MRTIAWTPLKALRRQDEGAVALDGTPMEMLEGSEGSGSISCGTGVFLIDARRTSETSVNALFNAELRYLVETFNAAEVTETKTSLSYSIFPWAAAVVAKKAVASARALVGHCR